ncbi:MAG: hypothetical protein U0840_25595 [Gemmataceae bacterium]
MQTREFYEAAARSRAAIAERQHEERGRAVITCGLDAREYARWVLVDRLGYEPDQVVYCCSREGVAGWQPSYTAFPRIGEKIWATFTAMNPRTRATLVHAGELGRWEVCFHHLPQYCPKTGEELYQAAVKRQEKQHQRERERFPLFADQIAVEQAEGVRG